MHNSKISEELIRKKWNEYLSLLQRQPDRQSIKKFELENLWPLTKEALIDNAKTTFKEAKPRGLISTVGFSADPIAGVILALNPEYVCFIHTEESEKTITQVISMTNYPLDQFMKFQVEKDDIIMIYSEIRRAIKHLIDKGIKETEIVIDATGGTKIIPFIEGLVAQNFNLSVLYVSYQHYDSTARRPVAGSERIIFHEHLTTSFPDGIFEQILALFSNQEFSPINQLTAQIDQKTLCLTFLATLVTGLEQWEHYEYDEAITSISTAKTYVKTKFRHHAQHVILPVLDQWLDYLALVQKNTWYKTVDIMNKAKRQFRKKDRINAAITSYSALELIIEHIFTVLGINRQNPEYHALKENKAFLEAFNLLPENAEFQKIQAKWVATSKKIKNKNLDLPPVLGLTDSFVLLSLFNSKLQKQIGGLKHFTDLRNKIVHRLYVPKPDEINNMLNFFTTLLEILLSLFCPDDYSALEKYLSQDLLNKENLHTLAKQLRIENLSG